jgi:putative cell wall-binding protein
MPSTARRTGLAALATSLVLGGSVALAGSASAEAKFDLTRISGADRYETAAKTAKAFGTADTVILVSGESGRYPDALTANYLAGLKDAPVLLTRKDTTPTETKTAIKDAGAKNIIIVGGTSAVSQEQQDALTGTYNVRRIAGDDRYATAAAVIAEGDEAQGDTALLATGLNFADALGGGPVAFAEGMPLAITRPNDVPDNVVSELKKAGITKVLILGGKTAIGDAVEKELADNGITVKDRFAGTDRAETSALLAAYAIKNFGFSSTAVNVASGYVDGDGADALGGAPLTGKQERALLITKSRTAAGDGVTKFLGENAKTLTEGTIFGGEAALASSVEYAMEKAVIGSGAQNTKTGEMYGDVQSAIDEATKGDTITVFGPDNAGFLVKTAGLTITGDKGATVKSAIVVQGADDVTISGLTLTPSNVGGTTAGIYLNGVKNATIKDNAVQGSGQGAWAGAGVIYEIGGADEVATITGNTFDDLQQGVFANPTADFTIDSNVFRNNTSGSANDTASKITNNRFLNNDEGVGLGAAGSTVTGNFFANNSQDHVGDYTTDKSYDLAKMIEANSFDEAVVVTSDDQFIKDQS